MPPISNNVTPQVWVILPCAGIGKRFKADKPKQYLTIHNKTLVELALEAFLLRHDVQGVIVPLAEHDNYFAQLEIVQQYADKIITVAGGAERVHSVHNALEYLKLHKLCKANHWVCVHDAARPCVNQADIDRLFALMTHAEANQAGGLLAIPAVNTLKQVNIKDGTMLAEQTIDRSTIWQALTPQLFPFAALYQAMSQAIAENKQITDEASAMELAGYTPQLLQGASSNIKVTEPADLPLAEFWLQRMREI
ncbi:MAG: 2-C-methyl-D-erythritol 4-phosphate cytidylyltransferase [Pseudomonadales bacterium]|nr:2-C-methyl-D-erythritol 4-phosphate cytidylyltransferase [Pseudomonadales bacterium]